ncbi:hypothetical protein UO65_2305 [Actinokineospora spheciospongiae]|uniref:Uncharacterized protein n=1 Tax=Actinokineospora spheciospongiae TaxID=909613 RepID=W7IPJ1_9PSEU|nr:hypothetical protein UO65_2305 [Actinokineospora spheciospongiae]
MLPSGPSSTGGGDLMIIIEIRELPVAEASGPTWERPLPR